MPGAWGKCDVCESLRRAAAEAVNRHIAATSRRELARLRRDSEVLAALEIVVNEAALSRHEAVAALKRHLESHGAESDPSAAHAEATGAGSTGAS